jgi:hypothetical protein
MALNQLAQNLASRGRHGDSVLVHMSPEEVGGLQSLAKMQGTSMTVNPDTGMPEAFSLGGFFKSLLPTFGGIALGMIPGVGPLAAGLITGGLTALTGGNALQSIMAGVGGYGGAGIAGTIKGFGAQLPAAAAAETAQAVSSGAIPGNLQNISMYTPTGTAVQTANLGAASAANALNPANISMYTPTGQAVQSANLAKSATAVPPPYTGPTGAMVGNTTMEAPLLDQVGANVGDFGRGASELIKNPSRIKEAFGSNEQAMKDLGLPLGVAALRGVEAPTLATYDTSMYKYDPNRSLNLDRDTDLRLYAKEGGYIDGYAMGGTVGNPSVGGGLADLYNRPEGQTLENISQDGYGIGRLNTLAQQESLQNAKTLGYAMGGLTALKSGGQPGGYLDGAGDGMSDSIPATIEGKQPARLADGEFVIPADVVSHLGNGSSKAGSKRLYAMLDKVRHARTGNKKQGKQINPAKYMPA